MHGGWGVIYIRDILLTIKQEAVDLHADDYAFVKIPSIIWRLLHIGDPCMPSKASGMRPSFAYAVEMGARRTE
jgi:hypothetical protein